jgi:hypothetical protein
VSSNVKLCIPVVRPKADGICVYQVCFTVHIQKTVYPVGYCQPDLSATPEPPKTTHETIPHIPIPHIPGEGIAPVTGESKTTKK